MELLGAHLLGRIMIQRPVCVLCQVEMRCSKNGRIVKSESHGEVGYFRGDEYACPKCGVRVIVGFGLPLSGSSCTLEERQGAVMIP